MSDPIPDPVETEVPSERKQNGFLRSLRQLWKLFAGILMMFAGTPFGVAAILVLILAIAAILMLAVAFVATALAIVVVGGAVFLLLAFICLAFFAGSEVVGGIPFRLLLKGAVKK